MSKKPIIIVSLSFVFLLLLGGGLAYASDSSKPGDLLYPVDKATEGVQRFFINDPVDLANFEAAVLDERYQEIEDLESDENKEVAEDVLKEVEDQQSKVLASVEEVNTLRTQNKIQESEHLKIMTKLQVMTEEHKMVMDKYMLIVNDEKTIEKAKTVQNEYDKEVETKVKDFEDETGVKVEENEQESEKNQGDESQVENKNQVQNTKENESENENSESKGNKD